MLAAPDEGLSEEEDSDMGLQFTSLHVANCLWALAKLKYTKHPAIATTAAVLCER